MEKYWRMLTIGREYFSKFICLILIISILEEKTKRGFTYNQLININTWPLIIHIKIITYYINKKIILIRTLFCLNYFYGVRNQHN